MNAASDGVLSAVGMPHLLSGGCHGVQPSDINRTHRSVQHTGISGRPFRGSVVA